MTSAPGSVPSLPPGTFAAQGDRLGRPDWSPRPIAPLPWPGDLAGRSGRRRRDRVVDRRPVVLGAGRRAARRPWPAVLAARRSDRSDGGGRAGLAQQARPERPKRRDRPRFDQRRWPTDQGGPVSRRPLPVLTRRWMSVALVVLVLVAIIVALTR